MVGKVNRCGNKTNISRKGRRRWIFFIHRQMVMYSLIHQHDSLVEVGGFAVYAIDFLQQAAAGE